MEQSDINENPYISDNRKRMIRNRAMLMKIAYENFGRRETEFEIEYYKSILTLIDDIKLLTKCG